MRMFLLGLFIAASTAAADQIPFVQYPGGTSDQGICFTAGGAIWEVEPENAGATAHRLTAHQNSEWQAVFSPDGQWMAYLTDRYGDTELMLRDQTQGTDTRLTWDHSVRTLEFWFDDAIWLTRQDPFLYPRRNRLYRLSLPDGRMELMIDDQVRSAAISPDGSQIAYSFGSTREYRKHYRGSGNNDLILFDRGSGSGRNLTRTEWNESRPCFSTDGQSLFYISDADSTRNIYQMNPRTGENRQLTYFKEDGPYELARLNADQLLFTILGELWTLQPSTGVSQKYPLRVQDEPATNLRTQKKIDGNLQGYSFTADGKYVAAAALGDLFITRTDDARTIRVTRDEFYNLDPRWNSTADTLWFASDRSGKWGIWMATHLDTGLHFMDDYQFAFSQVIEPDVEVGAWAISPDGAHIAWTDGPTQMKITDLTSGDTQLLDEGYSFAHLSWFSDSDWLIYQKDDEEFNTDAFLIHREFRKPINLSLHPHNDILPELAATGWWAIFISDVRDRVMLNRVTLRRDIDHLDPEILKQRLKDDPDSSDYKIRIDAPGLFERIQVVDLPPGRPALAKFSPTGDRIAIVMSHEDEYHLYTQDWDGENREKITSSKSWFGGLRWQEEGDQLWYVSRGKLHHVSAKGGKTKDVEFRGSQWIDQLAQQKYKFREIRRELGQWYYDPQFHGQNWDALCDKYEPIATRQLRDRDFNQVVKHLLGELNSSHIGIYGGNEPISSDTPRFLGVFGHSDVNGYRVTRVLPGSVADAGEQGIVANDLIMEVDQRPVRTESDLRQALLNVSTPVRLLVQRNSQTLPLSLKPQSARSIKNLVYQEWVNGNRAQVETVSEGSVAYVHVAAMNMPSLLRFERELFARTKGREVLIIDVRNNGGGFTTDYLLTMLEYQPHAFTIPRDGKPGYPQDRIPFYYWSKPVVVLINEHSFSNAEIFAHAIRTLGRGIIVGVPTYGGVISTDSFRLIDNTRVRKPFRGWYSLYDQKNMENHGCPPDILTPESPNQRYQGKDPQLNAAIHEALQLIRSKH